MSNELRAAAKKTIAGGGDNPQWRATQAVCRAWLADHPADEDTLIDAKWLEQCGWYNDPMWGWTHSEQRFYLDPEPSGWDVWCSTYTLGTITTRGDLRRLCAALGIELKEPA